MNLSWTPRIDSSRAQARASGIRINLMDTSGSVPIFQNHNCDNVTLSVRTDTTRLLNAASASIVKYDAGLANRMDHVTMVAQQAPLVCHQQSLLGKRGLVEQGPSQPLWRRQAPLDRGPAFGGGRCGR